MAATRSTAITRRFAVPRASSSSACATCTRAAARPTEEGPAVLACVAAGERQQPLAQLRSRPTLELVQRPWQAEVPVAPPDRGRDVDPLASAIGVLHGEQHEGR